MTATSNGFEGNIPFWYRAWARVFGLFSAGSGDEESEALKTLQLKTGYHQNNCKIRSAEQQSSNCASEQQTGRVTKRQPVDRPRVAKRGVL